tara:strand:+ start:2417 stop:2545 length:129 start_codon:yes stop_codon:yes gene_type:complete
MILFLVAFIAFAVLVVLPRINSSSAEDSGAQGETETPAATTE